MVENDTKTKENDTKENSLTQKKIVYHYICQAEKIPVYGFVDISNLDNTSDLAAKCRFIERNDTFVYDGETVRVGSRDVPIARHIDLQDWWIEEIKLRNPYFKIEQVVNEYTPPNYVKSADVPNVVEVEVIREIPKGYILRTNPKT